MTETGRFRGAGGAEFDLDLPLSDHYQYQVDRGELFRIDVEPEDAPKRPANGASKKDWVGYVVKAGLMKVDDADAMTRNDLAEKFGE